MAEHVRLVIKLEDDDQYHHVDCKQKEDDQDELEDNLRSQPHLCPLGGEEFLALLLALLLVTLLLCHNSALSRGSKPLRPLHLATM